MQQQLDDEDSEATMQTEITEELNQSEQKDKQQNLHEVERKYNEVLNSSDPSLLLPSVIIPIREKDTFSYAATVITRMDQECAIHQAEGERDQALIEAKNTEI